jgi:hypothetical protein
MRSRPPAAGPSPTTTEPAPAEAGGNQLTRLTGVTTDRTVGYDADNRPSLVAANGNTVSYLYGPDGRRLKKVMGSSITLYLGDGAIRA